MAEKSLIEWTDATWNHIVGCSVISPGCTNCYAMRMAGTRLKTHPSREGLTTPSKAGPVWNGQVRLLEHKIMEPLGWAAQRMIFVCAHGDLFHESVPDEWIDRTFAVMALAPRHTYQVLTKRSARMQRYVSDPKTVERIYDLVCDEAVNGSANVTLIAQGVNERLAPPGPRVHLGKWPLPNVWLGVSTEDQTRADERIPDLLATPAAVRWISAEPLLGPINLSLRTDRFEMPDGLHWVVAGGESGPHARLSEPYWFRSLRDQCSAAGVAFHFKQFGEYAFEGQIGADGRKWFWPSDVEGFQRVGKKRAGRLLDGVEHNGMPEVNHG